MIIRPWLLYYLIARGFFALQDCLLKDMLEVICTWALAGTVYIHLMFILFINQRRYEGYYD